MDLRQVSPFEQSFSEIVDELAFAVQTNEPQDVLQFCANFFQGKLEEQRLSWRHEKVAVIEEHPYDLAGYSMTVVHPQQQSPSNMAMPVLQEPSYEPYSSDDDEDDDLFDEDEQADHYTDLPDFTKLQACNRGRRTSVSAESMSPSCHFVRTVIPKTQEQRQRIQAAIQTNFLFRNLDEVQYEDVVNAMAEKKAVVGERIIEQGAIGDFFYIVESGALDCFIDRTKVTSYADGGSFGELALMYNSPRAATIVCTEASVLWALDRVTFRQILMENTSQKRKMYESFLCEVPILASLDAYERYKVADALESVYFEDGETVIQEGAVGNNFYLIESGEAVFYKSQEGGDTKEEVNRLTKGAYFGELALLNDSPRAATVIARGRLRCATLGKRGFNRLLGPVLEILKRNSENYAKIMQTHE